MAIVNNILSEVNDTILFKLDHPVNGINSIIGYTDFTIGETASVFFEKEFRYTIDGINWGEWIALSDATLQQIQVLPTHDFDIEYRYTRRGDAGGLLEWCWINLECDKAQINCGPTFQSSVFSFFYECCCDEQVLGWCINVLRKLYQKGIIMDAMTRNLNNNQNDEDRDFIDFWRSITCYFAMFVGYARKFENFQNNSRLIRKYISTRGISLTNNQSLIEMQFIMSTYYKQINQRGTFSIINKSTDGATIDGELLRLISYDRIKDEFLFAVSNSITNGWIVNMHSPLYKGIQNQPRLIKQFNIPQTWSSAEDVFPLINPQACDLVDIDGQAILEINPVDGQLSGISIRQLIGQSQGLFEEGLFEEGLFERSDNTFEIQERFKIIVDPSIDYELSFYVKTTHLSAKLSVVGFGFDLADNINNPETVNIFTSGSTALQQITLPKVDQWYHVRVILFSSQQPYIDDPAVLKTNINAGDNLKMNDLIARFAPEVVLDNSNSDIDPLTTISLKDVHFKPLSTKYGKGFVGGVSLIESWLRNNSLQLSNQQVDEAIRNYMISYKTALINNFL